MKSKQVKKNIKKKNINNNQNNHILNNNSSIYLGFGLIILMLLLIFISSSNIITWVANLPTEDNGGIPVNVQDQTTRPFDIRVNQILNDTSYSLTITPIVNSYNFTLNDTTNLAIGDNIALLEQNGMPQLYFGDILSIDGNVITLNNPMPYNFTPFITQVFEFENDLTIDGSTNTQIFTITNFFNESIDIVRILFHCTDNIEMHDGLFCGESELTRGLTFRKLKIDGNYINYWNVKNNGQWSELAYDTSYSDKGKPPDSTYGFTTRLTYGGQSKHGVVIRLDPTESIEVLIQDDLTGITTANLMVEGHFVQN